MAWRYHGHARVNPNNPGAFGVCDRCGMLYNLDDLNYQFDWRGPRLANLRLKVCRRCYDRPFEFFRPVVLPPDPVPRTDPRPEQYAEEVGPTPPQPIYLLADENTEGIFQQFIKTYLLDDAGNILLDDKGNALFTAKAVVVDFVGGVAGQVLLDDDGRALLADGSILPLQDYANPGTAKVPTANPVLRLDTDDLGGDNPLG